MPKKLTIEFVREQFEKEGYTLLSDVYIDSKTPLEYICPKGDVGAIRWNNWQRGCRCARCSGNKKLTIEFVREQFEKEGYTLLTKEYINSKQRLEYICPDGHTWGITWSDWNSGYRCVECAGLKKLTIEYIRKQFEKENCKLLTKIYTNNKCQLDYVCPKDHYSKTTWHDWQTGYRCKTCNYEGRKGNGNANYNPRLTEEERQKERLVEGYSEWCYVVKEKYNFTCQVCGDNKGGNLVSHHLYSYMSWPELRLVLENGVCLCERCHKAFHHKYGYGDNTKKQFEEFACILWHVYCIYYMNKIDGDTK